jgi:hypothetical protein
MDDFMAKPYTREDLERILARWTSRHGAAAHTA